MRFFQNGINVSGMKSPEETAEIPVKKLSTVF